MQNTDPAKELVDTLRLLSGADGRRGDDFLAFHFQQNPWSPEFFQILFEITKRIDLVRTIIKSLETDKETISLAIQRINSIQSAFSRESLNNPWQHVGYVALSDSNITPIQMLSAKIREQHRIPVLSIEEKNEILEMVAELEGWLNEHQIYEADFIRLAILEGIQVFRLRLVNLNWFGWHSTIESLRQLVSAYLIMSGMKPDPNINPIFEVMLQKTQKIFSEIFKKLKLIKEATETYDFYLKWYGAFYLTKNGVQSAQHLLTNN